MENIDDVKKFTTENFATLDVNNNYEKLINLLGKDESKTIFITEKKGNLIGFISLEQILKNAKNNISLKKIVTKLPHFQNYDIENFLTLHIDKNILSIPLVDQKEHISYVFDVFKLASNYLFDEEFKAEDIMEHIPFKVSRSEKIDHVLSEIKKSYIDDIVIEDNGTINGIMETKKLINFLIKPDGTSRGEKAGERSKFEGSVEDLILDDDSIFVNYQETYKSDLLLDIMEKNNVPLLYVKKDNSLVGLIRLKKLLSLKLNSQKLIMIEPIISVLSAPDDNIETISKKKITTLIEKHAKFFGTAKDSEGTVRFHKIENQSQKGMFKYETDIRISFGKGKDSIFTVKSDDWGAEKSLNKSYNKISRLISDKRKISQDLYLKKGLMEQEQ